MTKELIPQSRNISHRYLYFMIVLGTDSVPRQKVSVTKGFLLMGNDKDIVLTLNNLGIEVGESHMRLKINLRPPILKLYKLKICRKTQDPENAR